MKKKLLFFSPYFYPYISGITTYPLQLLHALSKKYDITVLTFPHSANLKEKEIYQGLHIVRMGYFFRISKGFISPQSFFYFLKHALLIDIVILNIPNFEGFSLSLIARIFGKKCISLFHCQVLLQGNLLSRFINIFLNLSVFFQLALSNKIVGHDQDYVKSLWMGRFFHKKFIYTIPLISQNPIDGAYQKKLAKNKGTNVWIGYVGRISQEKGLEYLIEAVDKVIKKSKDKIELIFVGPSGTSIVGENRYLKHIKDMLTDRRIPHQFLGILNESQLATFYKAIDILTLPSINKTEAFGIVQGEAMFQGTPVVASDLPGVRIPITISGMGLIVEARNSNALDSAIRKILQHRNLFTKKAQIEKVKDIFDREKTIKAFKELL